MPCDLSNELEPEQNTSNSGADNKAQQQTHKRHKNARRKRKNNILLLINKTIKFQEKLLETRRRKTKATSKQKIRGHLVRSTVSTAETTTMQPIRTN